MTTDVLARPARSVRNERIVVGGLAFAFGLLFGGIEGLLVAALGVALSFMLGPRWAIGAAVGALLLALVAVFAEEPIGAPYDFFASDRPVTSQLARAAGILAVAGVLELARRARRQDERDIDAAPADEEPGSWPFWPLIVGFASLTLIAIFTNSHGRYITDLLIGDNHFSLFYDPGELIGRQQSLWDPLHGLGRTRNNFWPVPTGVMWIVRELGIGPITAQRLWHAAILTGAGVGMAALVRQLRRAVGPLHVVAGLVYMFFVVSAVTLHSSYFLLAFALAPWFAVTFLKGVRSREPWRWAAVFALLFFIPGNPNYASIVDALIPLVLIAAYLVHVERSVRWREVFAWLARAALLTVLVSAAALVTTQFEADVIAANVNGTELPAQVARNSSWFETFRGLGWWLVYFRDRGVELAQLETYFTSVPIILASVAVPVFAIATIGWTRLRERVLFGALLLMGAGIMVGGFPADDPSPFGRLILDGFSEVTVLKGFRGTYKAGAVLALGVAGLVGIGLAALLAKGSTMRRVAIGALAVVALGAATYPYWSDSLYRRQEDLTAIPSYYEDAARWLDRQPGDGRVLVLPSTVEAAYTWGSAGDDIIDSLLDRPHVVRAQVDAQMGTEQSANLLAAVDDAINSGDLEPGSLAPILRRLGIRYVMVRNDLDWSFMNRPPPTALDGIRDDPSFRRVRTFGRPGEHVQRGDGPGERRADARRPPVEIFEVEGVDSIARTVSGPELLVSGDGAAWPALARGGFLDETGPVRYTGDLADEELVRALEAGSGIVVTDTNVRQAQTIPAVSSLANVSAPLPSGGTVPGRELATLFDGPGTQSTASYGQGTKMSASRIGVDVGVTQPDVRPANAFDGLEGSVWLTGTFHGTVVGDWVQADFAEPEEVGSVRVTRVSFGPGDFEISRVRVGFSDGTGVGAELTGETTEIPFAPRRTSSIRVTITGTTGTGHNQVGFSEIVVDDLDLAERITVPDDILLAAERSPTVAAALQDAPLTFQFTRRGRTIPTAGASPVELELRRNFRTPGAGTYDVSGTVRLGASTSPSVAQELEDGHAVGFTGSTDPSTPVLGDECRSDVVTVDFEPVPVRIEADAAAAAADPGRPRFRFVGCEPVELDAGFHRVDSTPGTTVDDVWLTTGPAIPSATSTGARDVERDGGRVEVRGRSEQRDSAAIIGESFDDGWRATVGDRDLGAPIALDTQSAWRVDRDGRFTLKAAFGPEWLYTAALVVTVLGLLLCLWLALAPTRFRREFRARRSRNRAADQQRDQPVP